MKKKKKKKRKFNPKKFIKIWSTILAIIVIIIILTNHKQNKPEEKISQETSAIANPTNQVLTVELEKPKTSSKVTDWSLILINKENTIPENYRYQLQTIENGYQVDSRIVEPLKQMLGEARSHGLEPTICSAYRATSTQDMLYNQKIKQHIQLGYSKKEAEKQASYWVTLPRTSEHEIGLAVDIIEKGHQKLDETQEHTEVQKWLMEHCEEYGFVLRYPTYKHEITKINYEPWHYRYVGVENAKYMKEKEICLEEYIEELKGF